MNEAWPSQSQGCCGQCSGLSRPTGNAATEVVGVRSRSYFSKSGRTVSQKANFWDTVRPLFEKYDLRSEEHTSELQSRPHLVCRLLLEKKKKCSCIPPDL